MKLKEIYTEQFAGIRDRSVSLEDGINVVFGKNESGKSTFVNLLSRTLFQQACLDGRKDKEFRALYFPGRRKGTTQTGDFIHGEITFETNDGVYQFYKKWSDKPECRLTMPSGEKLEDSKKVNDILKEVLIYKEGVYSDMLFSSQRNINLSLQTILEKKQSTNSKSETNVKDEIVAAVSQAFAEGDGIDIEAIGREIDKKIDALAKHWDDERGLPESKLKVGSERWKKEVGEVLKAYYAWEDAKEELSNIVNYEAKAKIYRDKEEAANLAEKAYTDFHDWDEKLKNFQLRKKEIERLEDEKEEYADALKKWPKLNENLEKAKNLKQEQTDRDSINKKERIEEFQVQLERLNSDLTKAECPTDEDITAVDDEQKTITKLNNKLSAMNLSASLSLFGQHAVEIKSLRTGQVLDITGDNFAITEAVQITIPDVMELQLAPADVNVGECQDKIKNAQEDVETIFKKYNVDSLDSLKKLQQDIRVIEHRKDLIREDIERELGNDSIEDLKDKVQKISSVPRSMDIINEDIKDLCKEDSIDIYIGVKENNVERYIKKFENIDSLKNRLQTIKGTLEEENKAITEINDIPEKYRHVENPEKYVEKLKKEWEDAKKAKEKAYKEKNELKNCETKDSDSLAEDVDKAEQVLTEQKELLAHWKHIKEIYIQEKQDISDNPKEDIASSFIRYLGIISNGRISSDENLNMEIYSKEHILDYKILSEGTKETVSLAFRLAVLDHLFPAGGGVIVFDDPLADMDNERAKQACTLIKECAKRHQVIFLTCHEEYLNTLGGNIIQFT